MEDKRFAHIATDPKFRPIKKKDKKLEIDKRFRSMLNVKKFKSSQKLDKRGRVINQTANLREFYDLSSSESSSDEDDDKTVQDPDANGAYVEKGKLVKAPEPEEDETPSEEKNELNKKDKSDKKTPEEVKRKLRNMNVDYARGESALLSESSSDEEESEDDMEDVEEGIEHKWGELDADAEKTEVATYRLAACNMDWDRIRATDLIVLFNSFVPQGGLIKSVTIYPSEFGKKRMKEEEMKGPIEIVDAKLNNRSCADNDEGDDNEEGSKYHMERLRQYQLNRLKYYYAVIICDSVNTANKIYTECDGMEYESSATKVDLRFIPDDMTFDDEPKEICDKLPDMTKYQPRFFTTTALQQAKVNLTWDETNPERIEITQKLATGKIDDVTEADLRNYIASSEEDESEDELNENKSVLGDGNDNPIEKYRALLNEIESKEKEKHEKDVELQISWDTNLKEKTDKILKNKTIEKEQRTPFEQYLEKRKEKKKEKKQKRKLEDKSDSEDDVPSDIDMNDPYFAEEFNKPEFKAKKKTKNDEERIEAVDEQKQAELDLLVMNDDEIGKGHFSLKKIQERNNESKSKKKRKIQKKGQDANKEDADTFEVDLNDERFSALFTSHHYNIDPTDSQYKKTKGMEKIIEEKLKRQVNDVDERESKKPKLDDGSAKLNVLIKTIKRNTESMINKKSK